MDNLKRQIKGFGLLTKLSESEKQASQQLLLRANSKCEELSKSLEQTTNKHQDMLQSKFDLLSSQAVCPVRLRNLEGFIVVLEEKAEALTDALSVAKNEKIDAENHYAAQLKQLRHREQQYVRARSALIRVRDKKENQLYQELHLARMRRS